MLATESEARIHAAREAALAAEAMLKMRQEEARELRKNHEKAVAELKAEMADKKRRGKEGVAARLEVRSTHKAYPCQFVSFRRRAKIVLYASRRYWSLAIPQFIIDIS